MQADIPRSIAEKLRTHFFKNAMTIAFTLLSQITQQDRSRINRSFQCPIAGAWKLAIS
jgi:hypothetical protein